MLACGDSDLRDPRLHIGVLRVWRRELQQKSAELGTRCTGSTLGMTRPGEPGHLMIRPRSDSAPIRDGAKWPDQRRARRYLWRAIKDREDGVC